MMKRFEHEDTKAGQRSPAFLLSTIRRAFFCSLAEESSRFSRFMHTQVRRGGV